MARRYKLKVGDTVTTRMLGTPRVGKVYNIRETGTYDIRCIDGTILPNCDWEDTSLKKQRPWYIIAKGGNVPAVDMPETSHELTDIINEQKKFLRGETDK